MPDSHTRSGRRQIWEQAEYPPPARDAGVPGRRTVTITGHGAEGHASRNGTRPSAAIRHRQVPRHARAGFRPDRAAMWAVLLGLMLILAAATSSHAAVLHLHHAAEHHLAALAGAR
jgi:hypothetical protein